MAAASPHLLALRVYYEDTDFSGVVYHASYLRFLERGRTEYLRALGIDHTALFSGAGGQPKMAFAVRAMSVDFVRPARMDDELSVETAVAAVGGASIEMAQRILRQADLLLTATVRVALVGDGRARRLPPPLAARLGPRRTSTAPRRDAERGLAKR